MDLAQYDNIVKALEDHYINKGDRVLIKNTLDLLKYQKTEIERLNSKIANMYKEMVRIALNAQELAEKLIENKEEK